jgi:methionyl aminopeptidase
MTMPEFKQLVDEVKKEIHEIDVAGLKDLQKGHKDFAVIDVREPDDFRQGTIPGAATIPRGVLELNIDQVTSDKDKKIVVYCGGGSRSALAAYMLQKMASATCFHSPADSVLGKKAKAASVSIETPEELEALRRVGAIVRQMLEAMKRAVAPGISTAELDRIGGEVAKKQGARSAPMLVYDFPGFNCISLNDEAVHGIPRDDRIVKNGDIVKLDVTIELAGFMADAAESVICGEASDESRNLVACAQQAFREALEAAKAGNMVRDIGRKVNTAVKRDGFSVIRELTGHGIGRSIHERPTVANYADPMERTMLTDGLVLTVEPIIAAGKGRIQTDDDGWTVRTVDRSLSAHYEHTMVITAGEPILLTA